MQHEVSNTMSYVYQVLRMKIHLSKKIKWKLSGGTLQTQPLLKTACDTQDQMQEQTTAQHLRDRYSAQG